MKYFSLILLIFCFGYGPEIGGGGSVHNQPDFIKIGKPTAIQLELSVWGQGSGKPADRYTEVTCHYKEASNKEYEKIEMNLASQNEKSAIFVCTIPAFQKGGQLEYYFTMLFDGHENRRDEKPISIK